jgi:hypothetical protein
MKAEHKFVELQEKMVKLFLSFVAASFERKRKKE